MSQGGDLIIDIVSDYGHTINHCSTDYELNYHSVTIDTSSNLFRIGQATSFRIVTVHHQAVKTLAHCFRPTAFAPDGIIEAYEWASPEGKCYLNAVQWHPEKGDYRNSLSRAIGNDFIEKVYLYSRVE